MPFYSQKQVLNLKLSSIPAPKLAKLADELGIARQRSAAETIKRILAAQPSDTTVNRFIRQEYIQKIQTRRQLISDTDLKQELARVETFSWGIEQGQIDRKIQTEYVRRIVRYDELLRSVSARLQADITNYVICTWFNHWTTVLIEEHLGVHPAIVPTLKSIKGIDLFFDGQPFDLKVTYVPRGYDATRVLHNPTDLAIWMYEHQGEQRFGKDNRLFIVLLDTKNPHESWKLKREFDLVFSQIDDFFNREKITERDEIVFTYKGKSYTAVTKVLLITK